MKWDELLAIVKNEPVFSSALLLAGPVSAGQVRLQLSRWVKSGRLIQLRRGVYSLAPAWRQIDPHSFVAANRLQRRSYVSLQSDLARSWNIPATSPSCRPKQWKNC